MDLGVEPYMISQGLHIVVAQRLARKLCPFCKRSVDITPKQRAAMGNIAVGIRTVFEEVGCPRCLGTGYCGRRAFFELLRINDDIRQCIVKNPSPVDIYNLLRGTSFVGLLQAGFQLVVSGEASYDEIVRVTGI
jgi:type II secretory ATPase GspE/PulE/Tfp pilus assembly ATPase PilB-like protein